MQLLLYHSSLLFAAVAANVKLRFHADSVLEYLLTKARVVEENNNNNEFDATWIRR
jgi:hypothetical protein